MSVPSCCACIMYRAIGGETFIIVFRLYCPSDAYSQILKWSKDKSVRFNFLDQCFMARKVRRAVRKYEKSFEL